MFKYAIAATFLLSASFGAQAHFIFLELPTDTPNTAHMRFAEEPLEETSPDLQEKSAPMKVFTADEQPVAFAPDEAFRSATLPENTKLIKGSLDYGLMTRGGEYLLVYHAKAARDVAAAATSVGLPVEASAEVKAGVLQVTILADGKPAEGAELVVTLPVAEEQAKATTDAAGQASFPIEPGGWVGVRARVQVSKSGTFDEKPYNEVRHYTTLTFPYPGN